MVMKKKFPLPWMNFFLKSIFWNIRSHYCFALYDSRDKFVLLIFGAENGSSLLIRLTSLNIKVSHPKLFSLMMPSLMLVEAILFSIVYNSLLLWSKSFFLKLSGRGFFKKKTADGPGFIEMNKKRTIFINLK